MRQVQKVILNKMSVDPKALRIIDPSRNSPQHPPLPDIHPHNILRHIDREHKENNMRAYGSETGTLVDVSKSLSPGLISKFSNGGGNESEIKESENRLRALSKLNVPSVNVAVDNGVYLCANVGCKCGKLSKVKSRRRRNQRNRQKQNG